jgi:hypothetical protein
MRFGKHQRRSRRKATWKPNTEEMRQGVSDAAAGRGCREAEPHADNNPVDNTPRAFPRATTGGEFPHGSSPVPFAPGTNVGKSKRAYSCRPLAMVLARNLPFSWISVPSA